VALLRPLLAVPNVTAYPSMASVLLSSFTQLYSLSKAAKIKLKQNKEKVAYT